MKKSFAILISLFFLVVLLFGCNDHQTPKEENALMKTKTIYAAKMHFHSNAGRVWDIIDAYATGKYNECILVNSEAESQSYGNDVIVAWPSENTQKILDNLNNYISRHVEDIEPALFSLTYPITMTDVVENWENVNELLNSFSVSDREYILNQ